MRDREGDLVELSTVAMGRPCLVDGAEATDDELLAPIIDGSLPPVPLASVVRVGDWVLWNVDGRVTGVAVQP